MKKLMTSFGIVALSAAIFLNATSVFASAPTIYVNGAHVSTSPIVIDNTTYIPVRQVSNMLGASVTWDGSTNSVLINSTSTNAVTNVIENESRCVVGILGNVKDGSAVYQDKYREGMAIGTGVIIKSGGEILTNAHVVSDMENIVVVLSDGNGYEAKIKYIDETSDLAVIKINKIGLPVAKFAPENQITVGEPVVALGTPLSLSLRNSASSGIISGYNRSVFSEYNLIQTDAAINPGNSGGPLLNMSGQIVGINSSKYSGVGIEGMGFSIPVSTVNYVLRHFSAYGRVMRPDLGVEFDEDLAALFGLPSNNGLKLGLVYNNGSAQRAGLKTDDTIRAVDEVPINSKVDWNEAMKNYLPGSTARLTIISDGMTKEVVVTFDEK